MGTLKLVGKFFVTGLIAHVMGSAAYASSSVIVSDQIVELPVDISTARMKLSQADYASPVVKVLVPELADVTLLNHRNTAEGAPCMATYGTLNPEDVIQGRPAIEKASFRIVVSRITVPSGQTCEVFMSENLEATIRGFKFEHYRQVPIGQRDIADCR